MLKGDSIYPEQSRIRPYEAEHKNRQKVEIRNAAPFLPAQELSPENEKNTCNKNESIHSLQRVCNNRLKSVPGQNTAVIDKQVPDQRGNKISGQIDNE